MGSLKPQSQPTVTHLLPTKPCFLNLPRQFYPWGPSIQTYESLGVILIQATTASIITGAWLSEPHLTLISSQSPHFQKHPLINFKTTYLTHELSWNAFKAQKINNILLNRSTMRYLHLFTLVSLIATSTNWKKTPWSRFSTSSIIFPALNQQFLKDA